MKTEKNYYKLADYFVMIGLDNYHAPDEVYKPDDSTRDTAPAAESLTPQKEDSEMNF